MSFELKVAANFNRESKRLIKKFPSLKEEIKSLGESLKEDPFQGTPLRDGFYKIRLGIRSKGVGKWGGARVITCVKVIAETVYLVSIYDKSEQADIPDKELDHLLGELPTAG